MNILRNIIGILAMLGLLLGSNMVLADKDKGYSKKGSDKEMSEAKERSTKKEKKRKDDDDEGEYDDDDDKKGLEKQRAKKSEQERKELGKGSEQGQKMREEHSRKWWRFWE